MKVTVKAAAKINLMLDILQRLDDGYHSLWMIMQSVGLWDIVEVEEIKRKNKIDVICSNQDIPQGENNIAYKAAKAFFEHTKVSNKGIKITIEKHIPSSAGLAGGSADAAAVILSLDRIYETGLSTRALTKIGLDVGADVPFCMRGGTMLAQDIGGVLSEVPSLPDCYIVLARPNQNVSTKEAFENYDTIDWHRHPDKYGMLHAAVKSDLKSICACLGNVFEQTVEVHDRVEIKTIMREHGALGCCMSGSGPTVFGIFDIEENAEKCVEKLKEKMSDIFFCKPVECGCEFI